MARTLGSAIFLAQRCTPERYPTNALLRCRTAEGIRGVAAQFANEIWQFEVRS